MLDGFANYGKHLGLLIQIFDDLEDIQTLTRDDCLLMSSKISRSLPVAYALEVLPSPRREHLEGCICALSDNPELGIDVFELIEQSGAVLYVTTEIERHVQMARESLGRTASRPPAIEVLMNNLRDLKPSD